jgi:sRNA-binding regulator protein Hfq
VATGKPGGGKPPAKKHGSGAPTKAPRDSRAPEQTFEEVRYIKQLIDGAVPVRVRLRNNEEVSGTIEYYDHSFIRLTRTGAPNLFIYKHDIKYLHEV